LEDEAREWARLGIDVVVSLLTPGEVDEFDIADEARFCQSNGIGFVNLPVPDRGVPPSREAVLELVSQLDAHLSNGKTVGIHCRQGIGRSGVLAACLLVSSGQSPDSAFERLSASRGRPIPETREQREWVEAFAPQLTRHAS
jgi:protein-tyrosine phosphatase